jgi:O-antigen ligase
MSVVGVLALRNRKQFIRSLIFIVLFMAATCVFPYTRERLKTIPDPAKWSDRVPLFKSAFQMFLDHPVTGAGVGMYQTLLHTPRYELPDDYPVPKDLNLHAHNTYLELLAETGVIGLCAFLFIFLRFFSGIYRLARDPSSDFSRDERAIGLGLAGSILAVLFFALGSTIITVGPTVSAYFWFLLGAGSSFITFPAVKNKA